MSGELHVQNLGKSYRQWGSQLRRIASWFAPSIIIERTDGVSVEFADWRFNLRGSNTEPLLRLNIETKGDKALLTAKMSKIEQLIRNEATQ